MGLIKKLRKAKKEAPPNEKPAVVKTHLRDMIIVPEMIGSVVGIYNGKVGVDLLIIWKGALVSEAWIALERETYQVHRSSTLSKSSLR